MGSLSRKTVLLAFCVVVIVVVSSVDANPNPARSRSRSPKGKNKASVSSGADSDASTKGIKGGSSGEERRKKERGVPIAKIGSRDPLIDDPIMGGPSSSKGKQRKGPSRKGSSSSLKNKGSKSNLKKGRGRSRSPSPKRGPAVANPEVPEDPRTSSNQNPGAFGSVKPRNVNRKRGVKKSRSRSPKQE